MIHTSITPAAFKLFAPYLPHANKHGIGILAAANLLVNIDPYPDMEEGDLIELFWGDCYVASTLLRAADIGYTAALRVPQSFLQSGKVKTYYRVTKIGSASVKSPCCKLWVKLESPGGGRVNPEDGENQSLAPVSFDDAIMRDGLSQEQVQHEVELTIDPYVNMDAYDEITLRWGDVRMDLPVLTSADVGKTITVKVPASLIHEAGDDLHQDVTYCIIDRVGNNSLWAPARSINVHANGGRL